MQGKWLAEVPKQCDLCRNPLDDTWVDGRTRRGFWAHMCPKCFKLEGVGLGVGKGQKYDVQTKLKLEG